MAPGPFQRANEGGLSRSWNASRPRSAAERADSAPSGVRWNAGGANRPDIGLPAPRSVERRSATPAPAGPIGHWNGHDDDRRLRRPTRNPRSATNLAPHKPDGRGSRV